MWTLPIALARASPTAAQAIGGVATASSEACPNGRVQVGSSARPDQRSERWRPCWCGGPRADRRSGLVRPVDCPDVYPWPASAWNDTGHQVVALIAWDNLPPELRSKLVAMMRQAEPATRLPSLFPEDKRSMDVRAREFFRRAATWPDLIREVPELHRPTWHHRDFYWRQDQGRAIDLPDLQVHPENLLERLHYFKKLLANPNRSGARARDRHRVGRASRGRHSPAAPLQRARHSRRAEGRPWRPGLRAGAAVAATSPG